MGSLAEKHITKFALMTQCLVSVSVVFDSTEKCGLAKRLWARIYFELSRSQVTGWWASGQAVDCLVHLLPTACTNP